MEISVADFSVPNGASVFKLCVHLQVGYAYCANENKDDQAHFAFFFQFFLRLLLYNRYGRFLLEFSQQLFYLGL